MQLWQTNRTGSAQRGAAEGRSGVRQTGARQTTRGKKKTKQKTATRTTVKENVFFEMSTPADNCPRLLAADCNLIRFQLMVGNGCNQCCCFGDTCLFEQQMDVYAKSVRLIKVQVVSICWLNQRLETIRPFHWVTSTCYCASSPQPVRVWTPRCMCWLYGPICLGYHVNLALGGLHLFCLDRTSCTD